MSDCEIHEVAGCDGEATWRVMWDMLIDHDRIVYLCDVCTVTYEDAILDVIGPIDPRRIPEEYRSRTLNRFIPKINWDAVSDPVKDCWEWTAYKSQFGYGHFAFTGGTGYAHRYSFEKFYGIKPPSLDDKHEIIHECRNTSCVNPAHLWRGTTQQNRDHDCKVGTYDKKLNKKKAGEIRRRYAKDVKIADLAVEYGVSQTAIRNVVSGESYSNGDEITA